MTLKSRSLSSSFWSIIANGIYLFIALLRSILLARWLPIEIFGIYTAARAFVEITSILPDFGMDGAFLHRAQEVEDEQSAAAVHFTLKLIFTTIWVLGLLGFQWIFPNEFDLVALILILSTTAVSHLSQTPALILSRRVVYRRLSLIQVVNGLISFLVAIYLVIRFRQTGHSSFALWALLSAHLVLSITNVFVLYVWRPVWRPKLQWDSSIIKYYLGFGGKNFLGTLLTQVIDRVDDLWTNFFIGEKGLGLYSRAYTFATYPRELLARPINQVTAGTYAELKHDRLTLSKAFFRANAFLVRSGFYFGGLLFWIAPEFIFLVLTDKWLPMLTVFRLMLVFSLFEPLKTAVSRLMVSVGDAARPVPVRLLQLLILIIGLFTLGPVWGIEGVAIAVNLMLIVGLVILFRQLQDYVDISLKRLFMIPAIALIAGMIVTGIVSINILPAQPELVALLLKTAVYSAVYLPILIIFEGKELLEVVNIRQYLGF